MEREKIINKYGRTVNSGLEAHITPRACMCGSNGGQYTGARGSSDNCIHCGCDCTNSSHDSGNRRNASTTIHKS